MLFALLGVYTRPDLSSTNIWLLPINRGKYCFPRLVYRSSRRSAASQMKIVRVIAGLRIYCLRFLNSLLYRSSLIFIQGFCAIDYSDRIYVTRLGQDHHKRLSYLDAIYTTALIRVNIWYQLRADRKEKKKKTTFDKLCDPHRRPDHPWVSICLQFS